MRTVTYVVKETTSSEIDRQPTPPTGKSAGRVPRINGSRITFGDLARFVTPTKTDAWLASVTQYDIRTCQRWLSGRNEPPAEALGVVMFEIMRRFHER